MRDQMLTMKMGDGIRKITGIEAEIEEIIIDETATEIETEIGIGIGIGIETETETETEIEIETEIGIGIEEV